MQCNLEERARPADKVLFSCDDRIGPGGKPTYPPKPADCEPAEASLCLTTSSFATTVSNGATRTTATQVKSTCATITGCHLRDVETTKTVDACTLKPTGAVGRRARDWFGGDCDAPVADAIVLPKNPDLPADIDAIRNVLEERKNVLGRDAGAYEEFTAPDLQFTAYFWIKGMGRKTHAALNDEGRVPQVSGLLFFPQRYNDALSFDGRDAVCSRTYNYLDRPRLLLRVREQRPHCR